MMKNVKTFAYYTADVKEENKFNRFEWFKLLRRDSDDKCNAALFFYEEKKTVKIW